MALLLVEHFTSAGICDMGLQIITAIIPPEGRDHTEIYDIATEYDITRNGNSYWFRDYILAAVNRVYGLNLPLSIDVAAGVGIYRVGDKNTEYTSFNEALMAAHHEKDQQLEEIKRSVILSKEVVLSSGDSTIVPYDTEVNGRVLRFLIYGGSGVPVVAAALEEALVERDRIVEQLTQPVLIYQQIEFENSTLGWKTVQIEAPNYGSADTTQHSSQPCVGGVDLVRHDYLERCAGVEGRP